MEAHRFQTPQVRPLGGWGPSAPPPVTLRVSAGDARRIIRALEATSMSFCGSPSASHMAGAYMRLAGEIRQQTGGVRDGEAPARQPSASR